MLNDRLTKKVFEIRKLVEAVKKLAKAKNILEKETSSRRVTSRRIDSRSRD